MDLPQFIIFINTSGHALDAGGFVSTAAPRTGVFHLAFPALAREWKHINASAPLAPFGNELNKSFTPVIR